MIKVSVFLKKYICAYLLCNKNYIVNFSPPVRIRSNAELTLIIP